MPDDEPPLPDVLSDALVADVTDVDEVD
ncbi:hypothetical protein BRAO285_2960004 [Bradyrhizobium sp. ORS 285]|nr:hypothetical protein BRAO285_2960004 [Bradyrhizobium sp. ORS 285]